MASECASFSVRGAVEARRQGSVRFAECLKGLVFFLEHQMKPAGVHADEFINFRPLSEKLVAKGQLPPSVLLLFTTDSEKESP
jgi:hypothetical protein